MNFVSVSGMCIILAAISVVFRQYKKEYSVLLAVVSGCVILYMALRTLLPVLDDLNQAVASQKNLEQYLSLMMKGLGICYISGFASGICADCGEKSLADKVELAAKVSIATLYVPVLLDLLELATNLIEA